jgi:hypothetical protein
MCTQQSTHYFLIEMIRFRPFRQRCPLKGLRCMYYCCFYYCCCLLFPLAPPPPRLCLLCAFFLCLLESELFSFAAFLSTCLLPLDLPTMVIMFRKIIYKYIPGRRILNETVVHEDGYPVYGVEKTGSQFSFMVSTQC